MTNPPTRIPTQTGNFNDFITDAFDKLVIVLAGILALVTVIAVA